MVIEHNIPGLAANRNRNKNSSKLAKSLEKLSTGYAINRAADNAAGLAVSEKMRSQIGGMKQAIKNCRDGISLIQTFEGALDETVTIIKRAKTLADQAANGTYDDSIDRSAIEIEYLHLCDEIDHIAGTDFNGIVMLSGQTDNTARVEARINSALNDMPGSHTQTAAAVSLSEANSIAAPGEMTVSSNAAVFAAPKTAGTVCGDFTVYGDPGDFSFDTGTGVLTILGGDVTVEGTGAATTNTIVVAKDKSADVTLRNVNIDVSGKDNACAFMIEDDSLGDVTVTLEGDNTLKSGNFCAGLQKNSYNFKSGTLYLDGNGALNAIGGQSGAGIGGGHYKSSCNIVINNGTISATSLGSGAGIGGGENGNFRYIEIFNGNITAISQGGYGAGIGGGDFGNGIEIYINGGEINAISKCEHDNSAGVGHAAAIGGGLKGYGEIYISGGKINAEASYSGAAIGGGSSNAGLRIYKSKIHISGGSIIAISNPPCCDKTQNSIFNIRAAAGIGGGDDGYADIIIEGKDTVVIAKGADGAYDIGSGADGADSSVNLNDGLISEPYTGNGITDGTIVHYPGSFPGTSDPPNPPNTPKPPNSPENPTPPETLTVSLSDPYQNATAPLTYTNSLILQSGSRTKDNVKFTFAYTAHGIGNLAADLDCTAKGLGMNTLTLSAQESANLAIDRLDHALCKVSMIRSTFGAAQNRLEHKIDNLNNTIENLTSAESRIRDTDMAQEMTEFTKNQILTQSSQAMLAQANMLPQQAMSLINS